MNGSPVNRPSPEHRAIRAELAATRLAFHNLLDQIPDDAWEAPTDNPHWNVRELLFHVILAPELMLQDVKLIRRGMRFVPPGLFDIVNLYYTRWRARGATRQSIAQRYDLAHQNVLALLDRLSPADLQLAAAYPALNRHMPGGRTTIADLYRYVTLHFAEHAVDVLRGVARWQKRSPLVQVGESKPPQGWQRFLFRLPLWFYRNHLGWLLGERFLLINHVGRSSGRPYQTVVEVVDHDRQDDVYTVASGWGKKSDWYKNLRAQPQTTIQVGSRCLPVTALFLSAEEGSEVMVRYAQAHPILAPRLAQIMGYKVDGSEAGYRALGQAIRFVAFRPRHPV